MRKLIFILAAMSLFSGQTTGQVGARLDQLADDLGIRIVKDQDVNQDAPTGKITAEAVGGKAWAAVAPVLLTELEKYPAPLLRLANLRELVVVKSLKVGETANSAVAHDGRLYFDGVQLAWDRRMQRRQLARAIFAMLKFAPEQQTELTEGWAKLNPPDFRYAPPRFGAPPGSLVGFLDENCRHSLLVDRSSVFACMMTDLSRLEMRSERDRVIREKAAAIRQVLRSAVPQMNAAYWEKLTNRQDQIAEDDRGASMSDPKSYVQEQLVDIAAQYGIEILWDRVPGFEKHGDPPTPKGIDKYGVMFVKELGRYPRDLFRRAEIKRIVLVGKPSSNWGGLANRASDTIYFKAAEDSKNDGELRRTMHHELWHMFDMVDDGTEKDPAWEAMNEEGFRYAYEGKTYDAGTSITGFVTHYATSAVMEDKAETFSTMMSQYGQLMQRAEKDKILAAKIEQMKKYLRLLCPKMDENFWKRQATTSAVIAQRWVPGRYTVKTGYDVEEDLGGAAGIMRQWGSSEYEMTIAKLDPEGKQTVTMRVTRLVGNLRAAGVTMTYDSAEPESKNDRLLTSLTSPFVGAVFICVLNERGKVDSIKGFDDVMEKAGQEDELIAIKIKGSRSHVEGGIRFMSLPDLAKLMPPSTARRGDSWKGQTILAYRSLPETEFPTDCNLPRIEESIAVIAFEGGTKKKTQPISGDGKPVGEAKDIIAYVQGELGMNMQSGMLSWAKQKLVVATEESKTTSHVTTRITPVQD